MKKYELVLKNEKSKNYRAISQWLIFFNLPGFVFLLISSEERISKNLWLMFSILATAAYTFFAVIEWVSKKSMPDFWHRIIFMYCALAWLKEGFWWLSTALVFFVLLDFLVHRKLVVTVGDKKIIIPSVPKKEIEWGELNNLILKDDILTIDFKNNRLFQHLILNSDWDINEKEFNDFCKSKLTQ